MGFLIYLNFYCLKMLSFGLIFTRSVSSFSFCYYNMGEFKMFRIQITERTQHSIMKAAHLRCLLMLITRLTETKTEDNSCLHVSKMCLHI